MEANDMGSLVTSVLRIRWVRKLVWDTFSRLIEEEKRRDAEIFYSLEASTAGDEFLAAAKALHDSMDRYQTARAMRGPVAVEFSRKYHQTT